MIQLSTYLRVPILEVAKLWRIPFPRNLTIFNVLKFAIVSILWVLRLCKIQNWKITIFRVSIFQVSILKILKFESQFLMKFTALGVSKFNSFECESFTFHDFKIEGFSFESFRIRRFQFWQFLQIDDSQIYRIRLRLVAAIWTCFNFFWAAICTSTNFSRAAIWSSFWPQCGRCSVFRPQSECSRIGDLVNEKTS